MTRPLGGLAHVTEPPTPLPWLVCLLTAQPGEPLGVGCYREAQALFGGRCLPVFADSLRFTQPPRHQTASPIPFHS